MTYVQPHLALQEWVSYLRLWNKLDREARSVEQDAEAPETQSQFDRKAAAFLQMFGNTTDIIGYPIHNCSSSCVLREQKQGSPEGCRCNGKSLSDLRAIRSSPQQMVQAFWTIGLLRFRKPCAQLVARGIFGGVCSRDIQAV